ncbi:MAG: hypothetical protein ACREKR_02225 [Candidatus Methylomirabilales bacterium]
MNPETDRKTFSMLVWIAVVGVIGVAVLAPVLPVSAGTPCCSVTAVDAQTGTVTAKEAARGKTFQFQVADAALLKTLKVGQKIWADFGTQKVSVDGISPCCSIVSVGGVPVGGAKLPDVRQPTVHGGGPCCAVVAVDAAKGVVTLKDAKTAKTFQVTVKDKAQLKTLKVGQAVDRNAQPAQ